tara:strand:+ start:2890 stop:3348 length:459 start_codon:yes stop_codon:yes gene_type:complete
MFGITQLIRIIVVFAIVAIIAAGLWYVTGLRADLAVSQQNSKTLEDAITKQQQVIAQIQEEQKQISKINTELADRISKQNLDVKVLNDKFNVSKNGTVRDFGKLAVEKPAVIQKVINNATVLAYRCMEIASGSKLNEGEKNEECPNLINTIK